jgi:hypothetical protein
MRTYLILIYLKEKLLSEVYSFGFPLLSSYFYLRLSFFFYYYQVVITRNSQFHLDSNSYPFYSSISYGYWWDGLQINGDALILEVFVPLCPWLPIAEEGLLSPQAPLIGLNPLGA